MKSSFGCHNSLKRLKEFHADGLIRFEQLTREINQKRQKEESARLSVTSNEAKLTQMYDSIKRIDETIDRNEFDYQEIETRLEQLLPVPTRHPENLHQAMCYGVLAPGKRVRPLLALLITEAAGGQGRAFALDAGCAVECVHTASLILDDLPSMDDAELRRGQPTAHRKFGEATAILSAIGPLSP